jgi:hypothetical protein
MAGSLSNVLASIPGLAGYEASRQLGMQKEATDLQQMGALISLQKTIQERARARDFEQQVTALGENPDPNKLVQIASRFASPDRVMATHQAAADRAAAAANRPDNRPEILRLQDAMNNLLPTDPNREAIAARIKNLSERPDKSASSSPLGKYIAERDALAAANPNDPRLKLYDKAIENYKPGGVTINNNPPGLPLGKAAGTKVDEGLLDTTKGIMTLNTIEGQFRPEFQQYLPRIGAGWSAIKDKMGADLDPTDRKFLTDFSSYKRNAINTMNEYIKSITGAAMSEAEAQRILRGMPNPGQGLLDGDSPTEFKAKLDDAMRQTRLSLARYEYIKRNGIALSDSTGRAVIPLERMPQIMNARGKELEEQLKTANPNAQPADISTQVRGMLAKEFGLVR